MNNSIMWIGVSINPSSLSARHVEIDRTVVATYLAGRSERGAAEPIVTVDPKGTAIRVFPPEDGSGELVCVFSACTGQPIGFGRLVADEREGLKLFGSVNRWFRENGLAFRSRISLWVMEGVNA